MPWLRFSALLILACCGVGFSGWLWRRVSLTSHFPALRALGLTLAGMLLGLFGALIERWVLGFSGLSLGEEERGALALALATVLLFAPLEEGLKVACVWPAYVRRSLGSAQLGAVHAVVAAGGFAFADTLAWFVVWGQTSWLDVLRAMIALPAHFFFAGLWGYTLGGGRRDRWFGVTWLASVLVHGLYCHIIFDRGPALLVTVVPMLVLMVLGVRSLLQESETASSRRSTYALFEGAALGTVREAMSRRGRPLLVHWIFAGALVTLGVMLLFLGLAVYWGHHMGIDFALADEAGVEGAVPIALLGGALLAAFPFSSFLIARASNAPSVLEPAWATGVAIIAVLALFSVTEPTALVVALGIAPVGFALACAGAWFGLHRH